MVYPFLSTFARSMGVGIQAISAGLMMRSGFGILVPIFASVADRKGRKTGMLIGVGLFTLGNLLMTIWSSFPVFFLFLILTSVGMYLFISSVMAFLGDHVPYPKRGRIFGIVEASWALSFIIGMPLVGLLIARAGWRAPFPIFTALGLLLGLLILRFIPANDTTSPGTVKQTNAGNDLWQILTRPVTLAVIALSVAFAASGEMVNLVFGVWLETSFGLKIAALGAASAVLGLGDLSGELLGGGVSDRIGKERAIFSGIVLNALVAFALPWLGHSTAGALFGLFLFYFTHEFSVVSAMTMFTEIMPSARATLVGVMVGSFSLGAMGGAFLSPMLYELGFRYNTLAAIAFNMLALVALSRIKPKTQITPEIL